MVCITKNENKIRWLLWLNGFNSLLHIKNSNKVQHSPPGPGSWQFTGGIGIYRWVNNLLFLSYSVLIDCSVQAQFMWNFRLKSWIIYIIQKCAPAELHMTYSKLSTGPPFTLVQSRNTISLRPGPSWPFFEASQIFLSYIVRNIADFFFSQGHRKKETHGRASSYVQYIFQVKVKQ